MGIVDSILDSAFGEIAVLLAVAAAVGFAGKLLRQPLIVSFLAVGLLAGPSALNLARSDAQIDLLSELGIAVLLFLVGIKLDVKLIRSLGAVSVTTGLGQVVFTSAFGYVIGLALGLGHVTSLYVAVALTFSSTIIIVKLLSDKREIDSLHGQIAIGFLIVQDLVVVLAMIVLSAIGIDRASGAVAEGWGVPGVLLAGAGLVLVIMIFVRYLATPLTENLAHTPELLVIFAIAFAAMFAAVGDLVGLGKEVGGLLAGVSFASTPYREAMAARLAPLRDFLLLFFFISLGAALDLSQLGTHVVGAIVFSLFVLVGNPLIVLLLMAALGYRRRTGFLAGLTVAQISEFSLIFVAMGVTLGHVTEDALGLVTMVGLVTIAVSTYMITYSHELYARFENLLSLFERRSAPRESGEAHKHRGGYHVIVFGLGRLGSAIGLRLKQLGIPILGVDFNPVAVRRWRALRMEAHYGDATDPEFIGELPLATAEWVVATVPIHPPALSHDDTRKTLIQLARNSGFTGRFAVTSLSAKDTEDLRAAGAHLVLEPFQDAAERAVELLRGAAPKAPTDVPYISSEEKPLT